MLRVVFMGTPDFAVPTLRGLVAAGHDIAAVYTQPPRPAGRGMEARKSPVQVVAESAGLAVQSPHSLKGLGEQQAFAAHRPDVAVVVAYGLILPKPVLEAPRLGCLNLHASALPRWRGAAPIQRALMAGDTATAATVMRMEEGLDTGPICLEAKVAIGPDVTAGDLHDVLAENGAALMVRALEALEAGSLVCSPQPEEGVTYAAKLTKAETRIDFTQPALAVHNHIRALSPSPGAWFEVGDGKARERIRVLRARPGSGGGAPGTVLDDALTISCGAGAIQMLVLQRGGRRPMSAAEFLRGFPLPPGMRLHER
ncbi:MAG TPA: methionyl-tRNA formyltransferase [Hyphomicrobiaceae bacterium]|nr:methionyl-tRNA formyltransferase [Hyphomicrobiaceae bacterium]